MAEAAVFEWLCDELEGATSLDRLEAPGSVRLVLERAGLETLTANPASGAPATAMPDDIFRRLGGGA